LKTIRPSVAGSEQELQCFLREANVLRQLRHPHIVAFHEMGIAGELIYFTMDYVPGVDAGKLLKRHGPLAVNHAVRLVCQALEALDKALKLNPKLKKQAAEDSDLAGLRDKVEFKELMK